MEQLGLFGSEHLKLPLEYLEYHPGFITRDEGYALLEYFIDSSPWQQRIRGMYDKEVITPRLSAWYGDRPDKDPIPWTPELSAIRERVQQFTNIRFDALLLNFYRDGKDSVAWHSDRQTVPGVYTPIASISLGQERVFDFRRKDNHRNRYGLLLEHGSLLLMKGELQRDWEHRIAKSSASMRPRINLTFRIVNPCSTNGLKQN
ncbi:MAG: alpha-ketoglutarate-dependent dioxygenase AlkB [Taibaiella sp.]|nr:alpha-ketoglutarate-dependent dioxygenase AlkB [Taibaiella sp.]